MSIAGLLISLLLIAIAAAIVARPLLRRSSRAGQRQDADRQLQREQLLIHYERVLTNIRDLDEDFGTGKLSADDHQEEREAWLQRGVILLRALDELDTEQSQVPGEQDAESIDRAIETAVATYRETARQGVATSKRD